MQQNREFLLGPKLRRRELHRQHHLHSQLVLLLFRNTKIDRSTQSDACTTHEWHSKPVSLVAVAIIVVWLRMKTKPILTNEASKNHVWKRCHTLCAGPLASFFRQAVMLAHVYDVANVYDEANSKWAANW